MPWKIPLLLVSVYHFQICPLLYLHCVTCSVAAVDTADQAGM